MPMLIVQKKKRKPNNIEMYKEEKVTPKSALIINLVSILQAMLGMGSGTEV